MPPSSVIFAIRSRWVAQTLTLNKVNPFDYLTELLRHPAELTVRPAEWMPWNYRETLARLARPTAA
jgi:hypothetical protein